MYITKILEYSYNYADYIVSDGVKELKCMCISVPLPDDKEPQIGMEVLRIYAFAVNRIDIIKITNEKQKNYKISNQIFSYFKYKLRGKIIDCKQAIVQVFDFTIRLEWEYPNGFSEEFQNGDFIEFEVDRLDCEII